VYVQYDKGKEKNNREIQQLMMREKKRVKYHSVCMIHIREKEKRTMSDIYAIKRRRRRKKWFIFDSIRVK